MAEKLIKTDELKQYSDGIDANAADIKTNANAITALKNATAFEWTTTTVSATVESGALAHIPITVPSGMIPISVLYVTDSDEFNMALVSQPMRNLSGGWMSRFMNKSKETVTFSGTVYAFCINSPIA